MKSLKDHGVPLGARIVFRLQWAPFMAVTALLVISLPLVLVWWAVAPAAARAFVSGAGDVLDERLERVKTHRARVIRLYAKESV